MAVLEIFHLPTATLVISALVGATAWFIVSTLRTWYRLRHIPGPFLASFSSLPLLRTAVGGRQAYVYRDIFAMYNSPLVRIGPNEVLSNDAAVARRMGALSFPSVSTSGKNEAYSRDTWYALGARTPTHDSMITILDTAEHDKRKARVLPGYGGRDTEELEEGMDEQIVALKQSLQTEAVEKGRAVDFAHLSVYLGLDVITKAALGQPAGHLAANADVFGIMEGFRNWAPLFSTVSDTPWVRNIALLPFVFPFVTPKAADQKGLGRVIRFTEEVVGKRYASKDKDSRDMIGSFARRGLNQGDCEAEAVLMVLAGSDTTSSAIRATLLHIMTNPRVYQKLKGIIAEAVRDGNVQSPIRIEEAKKIPYLRALMYEGLRIRPPAPSMFYKITPPGGDRIAGHYIPGGTAVSVSHMALVRDPQQFSPDPEVFRPERFLEANDETRVEMERAVELIFGYGRWACAGKPLAFMELHKIFFELLRDFDFELGNPMQPWKSSSSVVFVEDDFMVRVTKANLAL